MTEQEVLTNDFEPQQHGDAASMTELVRGIISDAQTLIKQQFSMLRAEVKEETVRLTQAGQVLGLGAALIAVGSVFAAIGLVYLLSWFMADWPMWACWFLVGGIMLAIGGTVFAIGRTQLRNVAPRPEKSLNALQENLSWIKNQS